MFSSRPKFYLLISIIILACAGLIFLQVRLLMNTAELKRASFDENVMAALARTAVGIDELEVVDRIFVTSDTLRWNSSTQGLPPIAMRRKRKSEDSTVQISVMSTSAGTVRSWVRNGELITKLDRPQTITVRMFDATGNIDTMLVNRKSLEGEHSLSLPNKAAERGAYFIQLRTDEGVSTMRIDSSGKAGGYAFTTGDPVARERVVRRVMESFDHPLERHSRRTLSSASLDSLMGAALRDQSIELPFVGSLKSADTSLTTAGGGLDASEDDYRMSVGLPGPFVVPETLAVRFPTRTAFVLSAMWPEIALSVLFIGLIVWLFATTVRTIVRQKEFAERLSDFISNMTHEFKTPLATISLASEALARPDVRKSGKKIDRYNGVIRDENRRLGSQVERILQLASLEEGDLDLRRDPVAMHDVITEAAKRSTLQVEALGGKLTTALNATSATVLGDRVHLESVAHNLIDNAIKYSIHAPQVTVTTENVGDMLHLVVRDRGIGLSPDQLERVFDKYYRVPTGNVHNAKGFGIGLSYVKLVVTSLGGTVRMRSAEGAGTEVEVVLPVENVGR